MGTGNLRPGRLDRVSFHGKIMGELYAGLEGLKKINDMRPRVMFPFERVREKGEGDGGGIMMLFFDFCYGTRKIYSDGENHLFGFISTVQHSMLIFVVCSLFLL